MLDAGLKAQLKGYLERLSQPVELEASLDESEASARMMELLNEIASLSPLVTVAASGGSDQPKPSFALRGRGGKPQVRFAGIPLGHEFSSLVLALAAGGRPPAEGGRSFAGSGSLARRRARIRDLRVLELPELPGCGAGAESHGGAQSERAPHHVRRRAVPSRGRAARRDGRARHLPQWTAVRSRPHAARRNRGQARLGCAQARGGAPSFQGALRCARRRRRPRGRGRGDLRGAQGHQDGHRGRTAGRTTARHRGDREFHLGHGNRGA